jgi:hypothetical protein
VAKNLTVKWYQDKEGICQLCGEEITEKSAYIYFSTTTNILILDLACFKDLTVLGLKSILHVDLRKFTNAPTN